MTTEVTYCSINVLKIEFILKVRENDSRLSYLKNIILYAEI